MKIRTGVDIIEIDRFETQKPALRSRFFRRVFTVRELSLIKDSFPSAAGRFAAKEAVAKALGCGIGTISWQEIEILKDESGQPQLYLKGKAQEISNKLGVKSWSVSISHSKHNAIAFAVALITSPEEKKDG